jgi:hypothetical protein
VSIKLAEGSKQAYEQDTRAQINKKRAATGCKTEQQVHKMKKGNPANRQATGQHNKQGRRESGRKTTRKVTTKSQPVPRQTKHTAALGKYFQPIGEVDI